MTSLEDRLQRALAREAVAGGDPRFRIGVIMRRDRRAARWRALRAVLIASVTAILIWIGRGAALELLGFGTVQPTSIEIAAVALAALLAASFAKRAFATGVV